MILSVREVAMKTIKYLDEKDVIQRGIDALYKELGPVEARRFLSISRPKHEDSVIRHRKWQASLNKDEFIKKVLSAHKEQARKS
jgi:hypothetical protein